MRKYKVDQRLIVVNSKSILINKILVKEFMLAKVSQQIQCKKCQHNEINNLVGTCFKSSQIFEYSNEYKTFENNLITRLE